MKNKYGRREQVLKKFIVNSLLFIGLNEFHFRQANSQESWKFVDTPKAQTSPVIWDSTASDAEMVDEAPVKWEIIPDNKEQNHHESMVIWEVLKTGDEEFITPSDNHSKPQFNQPENLEEAEALLDIIPLQSSDFTPLLNLSHTVPTALVLNAEEWRLISSTISPFQYADGTGNQNYAIQLDYGLSDTLQISGFYSEADDPLNSQISALDIRPANLWKIFGAAARWNFFSDKKISLALNGSLESWTVGSGGSDSRGQKSKVGASPNIFNDSGQRVETKNLVGSISLPLTWNTGNNWQFNLNPGINFLPSSQGEGQGGAGEFFGDIPYVSGGILWHPTPQIGITTTVAQPLGSGTNNFDRNLKFSRVPILSAGINMHLNPRIALQGQLTNGFGLTPATSLLTLPSDNRLGYSASFVYTADALDTPQPLLNSIQESLSLGGLTVNTALVPPDTTSIAKIGTDNKGSLDTTIGFSISNILHLDFYRSNPKSVPKTNVYARTYFENESTTAYRGSGKVVLTSPLRGAPIWSALRLSFGRNLDKANDTANGYLFAETPLTWEYNTRLAISLNPKLAWSGVGNLLGIGLGANVQITPSWELIPELNIVMNSRHESNGTLGLRWNAFDNFAVELYGSTASSIVDIGQLINAEEIRWGSRVIIKL